MEGNDGISTITQTSDKALSDIQGVSTECQKLFWKLSINRPINTTEPVMSDLMAAFNAWAANMGVFREDQLSLVARFKSAPDISKLIQQLLGALKRNLEKVLHPIDNEEETMSSSESDNSSDRSFSSSYEKSGAVVDEEDRRARPTVLSSVQNIITNLRQLELTIRRAGAQHRQERIQRFKNLDRNREVYEGFARYARQTVDYVFPKASETIRERTAISIATRRLRFQYLEQHMRKTSTLIGSTKTLHWNKNIKEDGGEGEGEESVLSVNNQGKQHLANVEPSTRRGEALSSTVPTKLDRVQFIPDQNKFKPAESVSSVKISTGTFPPKPKLNPGGTSFTCPYCFIVFPAKEASGTNEWWNHVIRDFEPFFCVIENCHSPFACADTYTGWDAHMSNIHTKQKWRCWLCNTAPSSLCLFSTRTLLETHLKEYHKNEITDSLRPTLITHSMVRDQHALQMCPFCGGFPVEIEKDFPDRNSEQAHESLIKHVRNELITAALLLAPRQTEEPDSKPEKSESSAQRYNDSERDFEGVGEIYKLECQNSSCDCKDKAKNSVRQWFAGPLDKNWEIKDTRMVSDITKLWQEIYDVKMRHDGRSSALQSRAARRTPSRSPPRASSPVLDPEAIAPMLEDEHPDVRIKALESLREKPNIPEEVLQAVAAKLDDEDHFVRSSATMVLLHRRDMPDAVLQSVAEKFNHDNPDVRCEAITSLMMIKNLPDAICQAAAAKLDDENPKVRRDARHLLEEQRDLSEELVQAIRARR
ncbi:hypothetical protein F4777DRAFT_558292 [Nemania sp. FL0916]|nr:hypothetical protein F4777DRAFT_558292 [Nemania sp. FL0916]